MTVPTTPDAAMPSATSSRVGGTAPATPRMLRVLLWVGVIVTLASFLATIALLVVYFVDAAQPPALFWLGLYAFPVGFALVLVYLVGSALHRRHHS